MKVVVLFICCFVLGAGAVVAQDEEPFVIVEEAATFPGGMGKFYEYVNNSLRDLRDKKEKIDGVVFIEFVIMADGSVAKDSVRVLPESFGRNLPPGVQTKLQDRKPLPDWCKQEAVRVIQASPPWIPGRRHGEPVPQRMVIPITFKTRR
jgi:protein TonB